MKKNPAKAATPTAVEPNPQQGAQPDPRPQLQAAREAPKAPVVVALPAKLSRKLDPNALKDAAQVRNVWAAKVAEGTTKEDLTNPAFWTHKARMLRPGDLIEVTEMSGAYIADLYVHHADNISARVEILRMHQFNAAPTSEEIIAGASDYLVEYTNPTALWRVVRKADKVMVRDKFGTMQEAQAWAADYEMRLRGVGIGRA